MNIFLKGDEYPEDCEFKLKDKLDNPYNLVLYSIDSFNNNNSKFGFTEYFKKGSDTNVTKNDE